MSITRGSDLTSLVSSVTPSDPLLQVKFLKSVMEDAAEADKFVNDPETYSRDHNVILDPAVVKAVTDAVVFDPDLEELDPGTDPKVRAELESLGSPGTVAAWPAAVAAVSAAVAAGAAVAQAACACSANAALHAELANMDATTVTLADGRIIKSSDF